LHNDNNNINQLVIISVIDHFGIIGPIRFQLKVYHYFDTIFRILTGLDMFPIFFITFVTKLGFTWFLFCFSDNLKI